MSNQVKGFKVNLKQVIDSQMPDGASFDRVTPKAATILSGNGGTLVEAEEGGMYLVTQGDWFRSNYYGRGMAQVSDFNQLQDLGLTEIKDKILRHPEEVVSGQEISIEDNVSVEEAHEAVASDSGSEAED